MRPKSQICGVEKNIWAIPTHIHFHFNSVAVRHLGHWSVDDIQNVDRKDVPTPDPYLEKDQMTTQESTEKLFLLHPTHHWTHLRSPQSILQYRSLR